MPINLILGVALGSPSVSASAWTPANLGVSLLAWWDSSAGVNLSGSNVTSWADKINGYAAAQATGASQPVYSATSFNGAPGLTFDGTDDYLELASQPFPAGATPSEIWACVQQDIAPTDTTARMLLSYGGATSPTRRTIAHLGSGVSVNGLVVQAGDGSTVQGIASIPGFSGRCVVRGIFGATSIAASLNGGAQTSGSAVPATGTTRVRIGAISNTSPSNYFGGKMRDIIVTGALTTDQAASLLSFLLNRRML